MAGFLGGWNTGSGGLLNAQQPVSGLLGVQQALTPLSDANNAFQQQQFHNLAQLPLQFRVSPQDWGTLMALGGPIAYHGSPYSFDAFDASKIGTGEGAQAYGHGLYFADTPGTAEYYRDSLAARSEPTFNWTSGRTMTASEGANWMARNLDIPTSFAGRRILNDVAAGRSWDDIRKGSPDKWGPAINWLEQNGVGVKSQPSTGSLYKVDIQPDPEQFLDWDKPLSEQPQHLATLKDSLAGKYLPAEKMTGQNVVKILGENKLQQAGIPGIRYLDQGSRGAGEGTHNYVVFDPAHVNILERNGQPLK